MTKRIAIVPARGGSKRIPRKNIRKFAGKPMIAYALETAQKSGLFHKIHVSTEDTEITEIVKSCGLEIDFERPSFLSDDVTPIMPVLKYVLEKYQSIGEFYDEVCLLMACNPLIEPSDLISASEKFNNHLAASPVLAVSEYPVPIEWAFDMDERSSQLRPLNKGMFAVSSGDLVAKYFDAGSFSIWPSSIILSSTGAGSDEKFIGFKLPKSKCIDIDEEEDWIIAEALYLARAR